MSYASLQSDVIEFAARDDVATKMPMFIRLGEAELYRRARVLEMETDVSLVFSPTAFEAALPAGFLGFKRLTAADSSNPKTRYLGPDAFAGLGNINQTDFQALIGDARLLFTIESNKVKVHQPRGAAVPITLTGVYFKRFDALSGTNTTNALETAHPDLFLYATLAQLWSYVDETEMVARYIALMDKVLGQVDDLERTRRRAPGSWERSMTRGVNLP